ncbi:MAG: hypothetical protein C0420_10890 [Methylobacterium sp.]|nr:hypothetical protein [Methylobacterium sp.]
MKARRSSSLRAERSNPGGSRYAVLDCFVADAPRNDGKAGGRAGGMIGPSITRSGHSPSAPHPPSAWSRRRYGR